jgi:hypothetical protein
MLGAGATTTIEDADFVLSAIDVAVTVTFMFDATVAGAL